MALVKWWVRRMLAGQGMPGNAPAVLEKNDALQRATVPAWTATAKRRARRILRRALRIGLLPLAVLLRVLLRILKPFVHIRFCRMWSYRLGSFALPMELFLCERDAGFHPRGTLDLWYHYDRDRYVLRKPVKPGQDICNQQLNTMFGRIIRVWEPARVLDRLTRMLPHGSDDFIAPLQQSCNGYDLLSRFPPHLTFTESEEQLGLSELREMGIEPGAPFVCFHGRDSAYLDRARPLNMETYGDWSWQDLRDVSIANYVPAAQKLAELGYFAIRMGKYVKERINCDNPRVIDYATQSQSDFMDVFLSAHCTFFISQNTGMTGLPMIFRRHMVFVNVFPLSGIMDCQCAIGICILKKYYSEQRKRFLTFREILDLNIAQSKLGEPQHKKLCDSLGLKIVENTPEEITEAVIEMHQRLHSAFTWSEEDQELQYRFLSIVQSYPDVFPLTGETPLMRSFPDVFPLLIETPLIKISTHFLRANRELLD